MVKEGKNDCILHNVLLAMGFKAWHRNKKKKAYIVIFIFLKFKIRNRIIYKEMTLSSSIFFFFFEVRKDENLSSAFHLLSPQNSASA